MGEYTVGQMIRVYAQKYPKLNDHKYSTFTITREQNYNTAHETLDNTGG